MPSAELTLTCCWSKFSDQRVHVGVLAEREKDELYKLASVTSRSTDGPSCSGKQRTNFTLLVHDVVHNGV